MQSLDVSNRRSQTADLIPPIRDLITKPESSIS